MKLSPLMLAAALFLAACASTQPSTPATQPAPTAEMPATQAPEDPPATLDPGTDAATTTPATEGAEALASTRWVLESFGTPGAEDAVVGETPVTLEFDANGQMGGYAGCNNYSGTYQVQDYTLLLGEVVSTLVACLDTAQMEQEVAYLDALQTISAFAVDGDQLTVIYNDGLGVLNFVRASTPPAEPIPDATSTPAPEAQAPRQSPQPGAAAQNFLWSCYTCPGNDIWSFANGEASRTTLPVEIELFYGYAPATDRVLYSSPQPLTGAGPSSISAHDLWLLDVVSGQATPIFTELNIVEADWSPSGEAFAYVRATDTTYELRWHNLNGEDTLLATDVAFTFKVSPQGEQVAFTRESNYGLRGEPGLYVVDVAAAQERMLADADRAGAGSLGDRPEWSPDGQYVLLQTSATTGGPGLVRAAVAGNNSVILGFDPALSAEPWYQAEPFDPMWISDTQLIGSAFIRGVNQPMGGPTSLLLYQLNDTLDTIVDGAIITEEASLVGWDVPGVSVWVKTPDGTMQSLPLPTL